LAKYSIRPKLDLKHGSMRIHITRGLILCSFLLPVIPVNSATLFSSTSKIIPVGNFYKKIAALKVKDIQKITGRRLNLKEKISIFVLKQKLRHSSDTKGRTALIYAYVGIASLLAGFFIPFGVIASFLCAVLAIISGTIARKKDPSDKKAAIAKLLGWLTLGLIALLFAIAMPF
jgi:hypothetical protein